MYTRNPKPLRERKSRKCPHPNCPVPEQPDPWELRQCTLNKPIWISIPAGGHIHLTCPVHPEGHIIYGPNITWGDPWDWSRGPYCGPKTYQGIDYEYDPSKDLTFDSTKPWGSSTGSAF